MRLGAKLLCMDDGSFTLHGKLGNYSEPQVIHSK